MESDHALVITDPLLLPPRRLAMRLREVLVHTPEVVAALPVSNHADNAAQTFTSVNDTLMSRLGELSGGKRSGGQSRKRSSTASAS